MQTRIELEMSVAGCILLDHGANAYHIDLAPEDFLHEPARAVIGCAKQSTPVDLLLVRAWAKHKGMEIAVSELSAMLNTVPTSKNFLHYLLQLKAAIYKDGIEKLRREVQARSKDEDLLKLSREINEKEAALAARYLESDQDGSLLDTSFQIINQIETCSEDKSVIATGWDLLDDLNAGGFVPGQLIVLAARPSVGKTAAALQIAAGCNRPCVVFSLEMSKKQLAKRLLSSVASQNTKIVTRSPSQVPFEIRNSILSRAADFLSLSERIIVFEQPEQTPESIRRLSKKAIETNPDIAFFMVDYLQLIRCTGETRALAIADASRTFKIMAKELERPVIILAQLNRACESENRAPRSSDLRDSGAIEQDADVVVLLHDSGSKTETGHKKIVVIQTKGRDNGTGFRKAIFNADHQKFYWETTQEEPK